MFINALIKSLIDKLLSEFPDKILEISFQICSFNVINIE
jgi:hypothetical protein